MMKTYYLLIFLLFIGCSNGTDDATADTTSANTTSTSKTIDTSNPVFDPHIHSKDTQNVYHNETFKTVHVEKTGETTYKVTGKARVFEAVYHYMVKDGNEVVTDGYGTTDAGAPEFGNFTLTIDVKKKKAVDALYLILFEVSAKDGSRQHELPIPLPDSTD